MQRRYLFPRELEHYEKFYLAKPQRGPVMYYIHANSLREARRHFQRKNELPAFLPVFQEIKRARAYLTHQLQGVEVLPVTDPETMKRILLFLRNTFSPDQQQQPRFRLLEDLL